MIILSPMKRKPYRLVLYVLLRIAEVIVLILPYKAAQALGGALGALSYYLLRKYRVITIDNLRSVFSGEKGEAEIARIARGVFVNLGMSATEILSIRKMDLAAMSRAVRYVNQAALDRGLSEGKGLIVIGGHFCNWEMGPIYTSLLGYRLTVIGKRIYYPRYNDFLVSLRASKGVETVYRDDNALMRKVLRALKSNGIVGIVPDQNVDSVEGVFVDFFGRQAYTPTGPARIALLTGAPVALYHSVREKGVIKVIMSDPFHMKSTGDPEKDILENTQRWTKEIEAIIRRYPSYWVWMHKRWKTNPK